MNSNGNGADSGAADSGGSPLRNIGAMLLDSGKITAEDAERALRLQKEQGLRFGDACVRLGLITQADIEQVLASQFEYPYLRPGEGNLSASLIAAYDPFSPQVEALRALRTQLLLRWFSPQRRSLTIVSPHRGDGRSYLIANLAVVFSQLGERTLVVDADMRSAHQHRIFNLDNRLGLSAVLSGRAEADCAERIPHFADLSVLPAGVAPPNPLELLSREEFPRLLGTLAGQFDVILVDSPCSASGSDCQAIAARTGGAVLVAREDFSRLRDLQGLAAMITSADATVVGCVLSRH